MKGVIHYNNISALPLQETVNHILGSEKMRYGDFTLENMALTPLSEVRIWDYYHNPEVFGRGIYIIFDGPQPVYVGMAKTNFLHRFQSHRHFDGRREYGYNKLARYVAKYKMQQERLAYEKESFYRDVIPVMEHMEVIRLHTPTFDTSRIGKLEKIFLKTFAASPGSRIYNEVNIRHTYDPQKSLQELLS